MKQGTGALYKAKWGDEKKRGDRPLGARLEKRAGREIQHHDKGPRKENAVCLFFVCLVLMFVVARPVCLKGGGRGRARGASSERGDTRTRGR